MFEMATLKPLLDKICASPPFRQSHRLQRFLCYVTEWAVARPTEALKEYAVAVAVYDKPVSFDPQSDPIVRVEAGRLRTRLHEYYAGAGQNDAVTIELPKGSYIPLFRVRESELRVPTGESLAVIPFQDDNDADLAYLVNGVSEAVTCRLAQMLKIRVAPWSMVLRTREPLRDLEHTARSLGVRTLVTLRLVLRAEMYELHAEWLDPVQKTHLWGGQYSRRLAELYGLEDDISFDLAGRLDPELGKMQATATRKQPTTSGRAYQLYLKGRHLWNKRTAEGMVKATEYYRRALDQDPGFGLAFAGIADCNLTLASFAFIPPQDSLPRAKAAASRALEIDKSLGEAQTVLACVSALYEWNWPQAQREFQQALTLSPRYPILRQWYGACLCARREFAAGKKLLRSAIELDPLSPMIGTQLAVGYYVERRYVEAIRQCRSVLENDAHFWAALLFLGLCHVATGHAEAALDALRSAVEYSGDTSMAVAALGHAFGRFGRRQEAEQLLSRLESRSATEYIPPFWLALVWCGLGERDEALRQLELASEERSPALPFWLGCEPRLDPLRNEARFQQLLQRVGLIDPQ